MLWGGGLGMDVKGVSVGEQRMNVIKIHCMLV